MVKKNPFARKTFTGIPCSSAVKIQALVKAGFGVRDELIEPESLETLRKQSTRILLPFAGSSSLAGFLVYSCWYLRAARRSRLCYGPMV